MKNLKEQKGITLIALIITIIVMLILVAVTINVALNGGIFDKATKAKEDTQRETDKEQILSAVVASIDNDGTVNASKLEANKPEGFTYSNGVFTNETTGKKYTVDTQTGKITEYKEEGNNILEGKEFKFLGFLYDLWSDNTRKNDQGKLNFLDSQNATQTIGDNDPISTTYTYDAETGKLIITANPDYPVDVYIIKENNNIVNIVIGGYMLCMTNGAKGLTPISGAYEAQGEDTIYFETEQDGKYGIITTKDTNNNITSKEYYCVIEQEEIGYWNDGHQFTYTKDGNGIYTSVKLGDTTYTRVTQ